MHVSLRRILGPLFALGLAAAACGSDGSASAGDDDTTNTSSGVPSEPADQTAPVTVTGDSLDPFPAGVQVGDATNDPSVGAVAPTLAGTNFDGTEVTVAPDGTPTVVMFVAHWCSHCQREVPHVVELIDAGKLPAGLEIVAVSTAIDEGQPNYPPQDWLVEERWPGPVMRDSEEFDALFAYGAGGFPFTVYLNGQNEVVARSAGELPAETIEELWLATAES